MKLTKEYSSWFSELKHKINKARHKTSMSINLALFDLYSGSLKVYNGN